MTPWLLLLLLMVTRLLLVTATAIRVATTAIATRIYLFGRLLGICLDRWYGAADVWRHWVRWRRLSGTWVNRTSCWHRLMCLLRRRMVTVTMTVTLTMTVTVTVTMTITLTVTLTVTMTMTMTLTVTLTVTLTMTLTVTVTMTLTVHNRLWKLPESFLNPWAFRDLASVN